MKMLLPLMPCDENKEDDLSLKKRFMARHDEVIHLAAKSVHTQNITFTATQHQIGRLGSWIKIVHSSVTCMKQL